MRTTNDGGQLSPCVELFIELLLHGDSGVKSSDPDANNERIPDPVLVAFDIRDIAFSAD
jgi:hypothetical protein